MAAHPLSEEVCQQTLDAVAQYGSVTAAARALGINVATFQSRVRIARGYQYAPRRVDSIPERLHLHIENGVVVVFSDAHYYPEVVTTAHRALVRAIRELRPRGVIANGDLLDGASISRHPRTEWETRPTVKQELDTVKARLDEVDEAMAGYGWKVWLRGNHDARLATYLSGNVPQYEGVPGFALKDHFPTWQHAMRLDLNPGEDSHTIVKHRWKGGVHSAHNQAKDSGVNFVTGHLHALKVTPWNNARGTYFGVDTGTLADTTGPHAGYLEDGLTQWRSGFAILTFRHGRLLTPEVVRVIAEGVVEFRGQEFEV